MRRATLIAGLALALAAGSAHALRAADDPELVSRATGATGQAANGTSIRPSISADGRRVAFESTATNLVPEDADPGPDIYLRDLASDATSLVSRGSGAAGPKADGESVDPALSADGRFVAFASSADNLAGPFEDDPLHVYVGDLAAGTTTLADVASNGAVANSDSGRPAISADGRFVAFETAAANLDPADADGRTDVYLRDLATGTTRQVSAEPDAGGETQASLPAISATGQRIAYRTEDDPDLTAATGAPGALYVSDLGAGTTTVIQAQAVVGAPSISAGGGTVAFTSTTLTPSGDARGKSEVLVHDLATSRTTTASRGLRLWGDRRPGKAIDPSLSPDGRFVAFSVQYGKRGKRYRLSTVVRDLKKERSLRVPPATSRSSAAALPRGFGPVLPTLSGRADKLAYQTDAPTPLDRDELLDVYVTGLGI